MVEGKAKLYYYDLTERRVMLLTYSFKGASNTPKDIYEMTRVIGNIDNYVLLDENYNKEMLDLLYGF